MQGTGTSAAALFFNSLAPYRRRSDRSLQYDGRRPGPDWHAHGYFCRRLTLILVGRLVQFRLFKRRWRQVGTNTTQHSRPPDDTTRIDLCPLIVVLMIAAALGVPFPCDDLPDLESCRSARTVKRWLARTRSGSTDVQQAIRHALIERCEPRPVESLFEGGLSPPEVSLRWPWRDPSPVNQLWRGLTMAIRGATLLDIPVPHLLAEARGRWNRLTDSFPI
ncbi:hypothetical protein H8E07_18770 [bacterium]|nr:hypothetical protein [bacterium]